MVEQVLEMEDYDVFFDNEWDTLVYKSREDDGFVTTIGVGDDVIGYYTVEQHLHHVERRHDRWRDLDDFIKESVDEILEIANNSPDLADIHRYSVHESGRKTSGFRPLVIRMETFANGTRYGFDNELQMSRIGSRFPAVDIFDDVLHRHLRRLTEEVMEDAMDREVKDD